MKAVSFTQLAILVLAALVIVGSQTAVSSGVRLIAGIAAAVLILMDCYTGYNRSGTRVP